MIDIPPPGIPETPPWRYGSLVDWMEDWFLPIAYRHDGSGLRWCPEWWRHRYAAERLRALWVAWETLYPDPEAASTWWTYHFDAHWPSLTGESGPFRDCTRGHVDTAIALVQTTPPDGWILTG
jgi:hypothetical protein